MKNKLLYLGLLFYVNILFGQQIPQMEWFVQAGGATSGEIGEASRSIILDSNNRIYTTGNFGNYADFDPGPNEFPLFTFGEKDAFVWKLEEGGDLIWAKQFGGGNDGVANGLVIELDNADNMVIAGGFAKTVDFDPNVGVYNLTAIDTEVIYGGDLFVTKLSNDGQLIWAKQIGGEGSDIDIFSAMTIDMENNIYLSGRFRDTIDFDPSSGVYELYSLDQSNDAFILKLNAEGDFEWVKQITGDQSEIAGDIFVGEDNQLYVVGSFQGTVDFDLGPEEHYLSSLENRYNTFILRLDENGDFVSVQEFEGASGASITVDLEGNVYVAGCFGGKGVDFTPDIEDETYTSLGECDVYAVKLDVNGTVQWVSTMGGEGPDYCKGMVIDTNNNVYLIGLFTDDFDLDPGVLEYELESNGSGDIFLAKLDASGHLVWGGQMSGLSYKEPHDLALDEAGNIYTTGSFSGQCDFDPGPNIWNVSSVAGSDAFVQKVSQPCQLTANLTGNLKICSGDTAIITAAPGYAYSWSTGATTQSISVAPDTNSIYTITVSDSQGCTVSSYVEVAHVNPSVVASDPIICLGDTITLFATGGTSYLWDTGEQSSEISVSPDTNTIYTVTVSSNLGCTFTETIDIAVNDWSELTIDGDSSICIGETTVLSVPQGQDIYVWSSTGANTNQITVSPQTTATYSITLVDPGGCAGFASTTVEVHPLPEGGIEAITEAPCVGVPLVLSAFGGDQYLWNTGDTTGTITSIVEEQGSSFSVVITDNNNFTIHDSIVLTAIQPDTSVLPSDMTLTALAENSTFQWLDCNNDFLLLQGATSAQLTLIEDGAYAVEVTEGTCVDTSICYVIMISDVIEKERENKAIRVYPNPTSSAIIFDIAVADPTSIQLQLFDLLGHPLVEQQGLLNSGVNQLFVEEVKNWASGLYSYKIIMEGGGEWFGTFVKQ